MNLILLFQQKLYIRKSFFCIFLPLSTTVEKALNIKKINFPGKDQEIVESRNVMI